MWCQRNFPDTRDPNHDQCQECSKPTIGMSQWFFQDFPSSCFPRTFGDQTGNLTLSKSSRYPRRDWPKLWVPYQKIQQQRAILSEGHEIISVIVPPKWSNPFLEYTMSSNKGGLKSFPALFQIFKIFGRHQVWVVQFFHHARRSPRSCAMHSATATCWFYI